jgi:hypothetical protein
MATNDSGNNNNNSSSSSSNSGSNSNSRAPLPRLYAPRDHDEPCHLALSSSSSSATNTSRAPPPRLHALRDQDEPCHLALSSSSSTTDDDDDNMFTAAETRYVVFLRVYKTMSADAIARAGGFEFGAAWTADDVRRRLRAAARLRPFAAYRRRLAAARAAGRAPGGRDLKEMRGWLRRLGRDCRPGGGGGGGGSGGVEVDDTPRRALG